MEYHDIHDNIFRFPYHLSGWRVDPNAYVNTSEEMSLVFESQLLLCIE